VDEQTIVTSSGDSTCVVWDLTQELDSRRFINRALAELMAVMVHRYRFVPPGDLVPVASDPKPRGFSASASKQAPR
jgi:hypothetical protein